MTARCATAAPAFCINCGRRHTGTCDATAPWVREMRPMAPTDAQRVKVLEKMLAEHHQFFATAHSALLAGNVDYAIEVLAGVLNPRGRS